MTLTRDKVEKYQTRKCRVNSHSSVAVRPPINACLNASRPTGMTIYSDVNNRISPIRPSIYIAVAVSGFSDSALGIWKAYFFEPALLFILILNIFKDKNGTNKIEFSGC